MKPLYSVYGTAWQACPRCVGFLNQHSSRAGQRKDVAPRRDADTPQDGQVVMLGDDGELHRVQKRFG